MMHSIMVVIVLAFEADACCVFCTCEGGPCPTACKSSSDATTCRECISSHYLHNGACVGSCPDGYAGYGKLCGKTCVKEPCSTDCNECSNPTTCTTCDSSKYLHNGTCVSSCPAGFSEKGQLYGKTCEKEACSTDCKECSNPTTCTECDRSHYLHNGACVSSCPAGYSEKGLVYGKTCEKQSTVERGPCTKTDMERLRTLGPGWENGTLAHVARACGDQHWGLSMSGLTFDKDSHVECIKTSMSITNACGLCFTSHAEFGFNNCKSLCAINWCSRQCLDCNDQYLARFDTCVGNTTPRNEPCDGTKANPAPAPPAAPTPAAPSVSSTGTVAMKMSKEHATALAAKPTKKSAFANAIAMTTGLAVSKITITAVYVDGVGVARRLATVSTVTFDWEAKHTSAVTAAQLDATTLQQQIMAEVKAVAGVTVVITALPTVTTNTASGATTSASGTSSAQTVGVKEDEDGFNMVWVIFGAGLVLVGIPICAACFCMRRGGNNKVKPEPVAVPPAQDGTESQTKMSTWSTYSESNRRPLPEGKDFHFFLSHKKSHSKLGMQPAQLAGHMKDLLDAKGFVGFFDVDGLNEISMQQLERSVKRSCTVIVLLNDETCDSTWCKFEWEVAQREGIPLKCVVDAQNASKSTILNQVLASEDKVINKVRGWLLRYQWAEHLDKFRKQVVEGLAEWLADVLENPDQNKARVSCHSTVS